MCCRGMLCNQNPGDKPQGSSIRVMAIMTDGKAIIADLFVHGINCSLRWSDHMIFNGEMDVPARSDETTSLATNCVKRRRKDPLRPRGYMSAFNFFARDCRSRLLNDNPSLQVRCLIVRLSMLLRSGRINRPKQQRKQDSGEEVEGAIPTEASCV